MTRPLVSGWCRVQVSGYLNLGDAGVGLVGFGFVFLRARVREEKENPTQVTPPTPLNLKRALETRHPVSKPDTTRHPVSGCLFYAVWFGFGLRLILSFWFAVVVYGKGVVQVVALGWARSSK